MGMLGEDGLGGVSGGRVANPPPHIAGHLSAMRAAFAGMSAGRLPPHLLFSDRDFNEDDYEALLALDDTVENRKGGLLAVCIRVMLNLPASDHFAHALWCCAVVAKALHEFLCDQHQSVLHER